jgi:hypothetical protein
MSTTHLRGLYRKKTDAGLSPRTVQYIHVTLPKALKQAVNDGLVKRNVCEAVKPPQLHREEIKPLTFKQAKALLKTIRGDRLEALYVLGVTTLALCCEPFTKPSSARDLRRPHYKNNLVPDSSFLPFPTYHAIGS